MSILGRSTQSSVTQPQALLGTIYSAVSLLPDAQSNNNSFTIVENVNNTNENGMYQAQEVSPGVFSWVKVMETAPNNLVTNRILSRGVHGDY